jgi:hypothetical protein
MKIHSILVATALAASMAGFAQNTIPSKGKTAASKSDTKKAQDAQSIQAQCGCHQVMFEYAETLSPDKQYKTHDVYKVGGWEYVFADESTPDKIVIQHLLIVGDTMIVKHWREDWVYENTDLLHFEKEATWQKQKLTKAQVGGQWTQKVFEVDDAPRYEGTATWIHADGRHYWENTTDAPLPRREYSKRSDYNVMRRTNHHEITSYGYLHEQDNEKIIRSEAGDQLLVREKGYNTYRRTDESRCDIARNWWKQHRAFWVTVRGVWNEMLAKADRVQLQGKVDGKYLGEALGALETKGNASKAEIETVIRKYWK